MPFLEGVEEYEAPRLLGTNRVLVRHCGAKRTLSLLIQVNIIFYFSLT